MAAVCKRNSFCSSSESECGGSEQAESPECTPASSMCSMMPPIADVLAIAQGVDVNFDGVVEKAVKQHRRVVRHLKQLRAYSAQGLPSGARFPSRGRQHVARAHHQRIADLFGQAQGVRFVARVRFGGCFSFKIG